MDGLRSSGLGGKPDVNEGRGLLSIEDGAVFTEWTSVDVDGTEAAELVLSIDCMGADVAATKFWKSNALLTPLGNSPKGPEKSGKPEVNVNCWSFMNCGL